MLFSSLSLFIATASAAALSGRQTATPQQVCSQIASQIEGKVYYTALSPQYRAGNEHYMTSSSQSSACVVEVVNAQDISKALKLIGANKTPFGVKSGGHASNQGFSSTTGVQISLTKINRVVLSADKKTVEVGLGNLWSDVYTSLDGSGVNVVGGRVPGPGTGGFTLGGGYSWYTNQYGLSCDTVKAFNLVLPDGTITYVDSSKSDLFFALKGGLNRFGIVSSIVFNTVPATNMVYGGIQIFGADKIPALLEATHTFQTQNTDPKAQLILTVNGGILPNAILLLFYDGPTRPAAFDPYNSISGGIINNVQSQSFKSFSNAAPAGFSAGNRGAFGSLSTTTFTPTFLTAVYNESQFYSKQALARSATLLSYDVEPFTNYGQYATDSAYPHSQSPLPLNLYFSWTNSAQDAYWRAAMQKSIDTLTAVAKAEGIYRDDPVYPNYALENLSGAQLYGANTERLRAIQKQYDPTGIMYQAGGFKI